MKVSSFLVINVKDSFQIKCTLGNTLNLIMRVALEISSAINVNTVPATRKILTITKEEFIENLPANNVAKHFQFIMSLRDILKQNMKDVGLYAIIVLENTDNNIP